MDNYRAGIIASCILNVNRQDKSDKVYQPSDFFTFDKSITESTEINDDKITENLMMFYSAVNAAQKGG
jgi:hypothetical protein